MYFSCPSVNGAELRQTRVWPADCHVGNENPRRYQVIEVFGGRTRTRTLDPLIKSQLLYQLSYAP
jgi:hypothetical protein